MKEEKTFWSFGIIIAVVVTYRYIFCTDYLSQGCIIYHINHVFLACYTIPMQHTYSLNKPILLTKGSISLIISQVIHLSDMSHRLSSTRYSFTHPNHASNEDIATIDGIPSSSTHLILLSIFFRLSFLYLF